MSFRTIQQPVHGFIFQLPFNFFMNTFIINTFNTLCKNISILFFAFSLFCFTHSPLYAATTTFDNGFESGNISGFSCSGNCPTVTTSPISTGKYAGDAVLTRSSKVNYRTEITLANGKGNFYQDKEYWFGLNFRFEDWAKDTDGDFAPLQIHLVPGSWDKDCGESAAAIAPLLFSTKDDQLRVLTYGGKVRWTQALKKKQWQSTVVHYIPSKSSNGLIEVWVDGAKVVSVAGTNIDAADRCGNPYKDRSFLKLGIYKWSWKQYTTQSSRRQIIIDNVKVASGSDGYSTFKSTSTTQSTSSTSTTSATSSTSTTNSAEDLVASWPMNTGTSTTTPDVSGNGYTATLVNGAQLTSSGTVKLDGVNDYVNVGKPAVSGSAMTISAWLWADDLANCSSSDCRIISKAIGLAEQDHDFMISTVKVNSATRLRFRLNTSGATSTLTAGSGNILNKEWVHVAAVYDGKSMRLYQDGVLVGSRAKTGNITLRNTGSTWIGGNPPSTTARPWKGQIDDVAIYNYALTGAEIAELAK